MKIAFIFPGQGSQSVGMGTELAEAYPQARSIFSSADDVLGYPLTRIMWNGPREELDDTRNTQPAVLTHSIAAFEIVRDLFPIIRPAYVMGHSLGSLTALYASGAMGIYECIRLARSRAELMHEAGQLVPGGMAAVIGLDYDKVSTICHSASARSEPVSVANDNCPGQVVISGALPALQRAMDMSKAAGARRVMPLPVSIATHSVLMEPAQEKYDQALMQIRFRNADPPIFCTSFGKPLYRFDDIALDQSRMFAMQVRWRGCVEILVGHGITHMVELGNGSVLSGLGKRITSNCSFINFGNPSDLPALAEFLTPFL